jgi:hypothetical protein
LARGTGESLSFTAPFTLNEKTGEKINIACSVTKAGPNALKWRYTLSADRDIPLTMLVADVSLLGKSPRGQMRITAGGKETTLKVPNPRLGDFTDVSQVVIDTEDAGSFTFTLDPPLTVGPQSASLRLELAANVLKAGERTVSVTLTAPVAIDLQASVEKVEANVKHLVGPDWFAFVAKGNAAPAVIGMEDWLDKPAGKHGGVRIADDADPPRVGLPFRRAAAGHRSSVWPFRMDHLLPRPVQR